MWSNLPFDVLANIFSFLPPDSLACATTACKNWHTCATAYPWFAIPHSRPKREPAWFVALPTRSRGLCCYVHNPVANKWYFLSLDWIPGPIRPVGSVGGLVIVRPTNSMSLQLGVCNPFTKQFSHLPKLNITRTNPAIGVVVSSSAEFSPFPNFRIYVAGGMSEAPHGGATYKSKVEMYDSEHDTWEIVGPMPVEFAVRLTVWTSSESVCSNEVLYWITSARAYSVMSFDIKSSKWKELSVPMADKLEFATLVSRNGQLTLVGGASGNDASVWELDEGDNWCLIEKVPIEMCLKLLEGKGSWCSTKCVGSDGTIILYRELGSGMIMWREVGEKGRWEWFWVEGCSSIGCKRVPKLSIKGVFVHPSLAPMLVVNK